MSELVSAVLLGVVEGLTEFIPVSSTGHLILFGDLLEFAGKRADTFSVFIQLGAILAVVFIYPDRFRKLLDFKSKDSFSGYNGLLRLFVASLPALVLGVLVYDYIKEYLFSPLTVAAALIIGGIALVFIERLVRKSTKAEFKEISLKDCLLIGCFQCLAMWPGMSRSGSCIIGSMLLGCNKKLAAEFSFYMAVPIMVAAVSYDLLKSWSFLSIKDLPIFLIGFVVSFIVAVLAIKFFLKVLNKYSLAPFGIYRIILGIIVIALLV